LFTDQPFRDYIVEFWNGRSLSRHSVVGATNIDTGIANIIFMILGGFKTFKTDLGKKKFFKACAASGSYPFMFEPTDIDGFHYSGQFLVSKLILTSSVM
jgi:hypothetical protein